MTVVEMMIACTVVVLLGIMTVQFLIPAMAMSAQGGIRAEMQQQGSIALIGMVRDLSQTSIGGISLLPPNGSDPCGFAVNRIASASDQSQTWEPKVVCYFYYPTTRKLMRKDYPPDPPNLGLPFNPSRPTRVPAADLLQIANGTNDTEMSLAINVEAFTVTMPGRSPIEIKLKLQQTVPHSQKVETLELVRSVTVRNDS